MAEKSKLQQLIDDKVAAGLPLADAREVAQRQIEHDDRLAAEAAAAEKAAKKAGKDKVGTTAGDAS